MDINENDFIAVDGSTNVDGNYLVWHQNKLLRIITENISFYVSTLQIINENPCPNLIKTKLISQTDTMLILEHEVIDNVTYAIEWTRRQKIIALRATLIIQQYLVTYGLTLKDPHAFNITFKCDKPVYLDYGSISNPSYRLYKWFYRDLMKINNYPEVGWASIIKISKYKIICISTMLSLLSNRLGMKVLIKIYSVNELKTKPSIIMRALIYLGDMIKKIKRLKQLTVYHYAVRIFRKLQSNSKNTHWTNYNQNTTHTNIKSDRVRNMISIINEHRPITMLDIGANKGHFSQLALDKGVKQVVSMDLDEKSLDQLFNHYHIRHKKGYCVKADLMHYPENINNYARYGTFQPLYNRIKSDFVICLAVIHHICYFGNYNFDEFINRIKKFATKILVIEFVPYTDVHLTGKIYNHKDKSWYTQEKFIEAMSRNGYILLMVNSSTPSPRTLISFKKIT